MRVLVASILATILGFVLVRIVGSRAAPSALDQASDGVFEGAANAHR